MEACKDISYFRPVVFTAGFESPKKLLNTKHSCSRPGLLNNINKILGIEARYFDDTLQVTVM